MNKDQSTLTSFIGLDREIDSWLEKRSNIDVEIEELIREMARQVFVALGGEARDDEILASADPPRLPREVQDQFLHHPLAGAREILVLLGQRTLRLARWKPEELFPPATM